MGSIHLETGINVRDLMSTGYRKYWMVQDAAVGDVTEGDCGKKPPRNGFRARSRSCSAPGARSSNATSTRTGREADFRDSKMVVVDAHSKARRQFAENELKKRMAKPEMKSTGPDVEKVTDDNVPNSNKRINGSGGNRRILVRASDNNRKGFARLDVKTLQNIGWTPNEEGEAEKPTDHEQEAEDFYRMTKVEFRKLQEQVRDVSMNLRNRFRTSAYQPGTGDHLEPKKLYQRPNGENTNQVYRTQLAASLKAFKQKNWPPINHQELDPTFFRCKPVTQTNERPQTSCSIRGGPPRLQRPKSVPPAPGRSKSALGAPVDGRPGKYDTLSPSMISELMGSVDRPTSDYEGSPDDQSPLLGVLQNETKKLLDRDDASTTSGIDSGASDNDSPSSDEDSDFEPDIDPDIHIPELNLRPEKLDAIYIPEAKRGWRQYDFDMSNIDMPVYEFKNPFPDYVDEVDLKQMAKLKWNWRNHLKTKTGQRDSDLEGILDRLVEFEKLQIDTVDWEQKRAFQAKRVLARRNVSSAKSRDRRCDPLCLQPTCFGDCPEKLVQSVCEYCRQSYCTGTCKEMKYEQRMRQPRTEEEQPAPPRMPFPRACNSCQKRHNAKFINANNMILGTQRFNNSTYARGQGSAKQKDLRPKSCATLTKDVLKEFEKMNIESTQPSRPSTAMSMASRPRSRNSIIPGKSFNSQRKNSLTDLDKISARKKRSKMPKGKRPKTAA